MADMSKEYHETALRELVESEGWRVLKESVGEMLKVMNDYLDDPEHFREKRYLMVLTQKKAFNVLLDLPDRIIKLRSNKKDKKEDSFDPY